MRSMWWLLFLLMFAGMPVCADNPQLDQARAEKEAAFARYTRLATEGGEGDVQAALAEYRAAKARLDALTAQATTEGVATPVPEAAAVAATATAGAAEPAVEAALRRLLDAQAVGDADAMYAALATAHLSESERAVLQGTLAARAPRARFGELDLRTEALGIRGDFALLRYSYRLQLDDSEPQAGGNLALLLREGSAWRVQQIVVDEPLTLAVLRRAAQASRAQPRSGAQCANPPPPRRALIDSEEFQQLANAAIHTWRADEGKITRDLAYSAFGRIPLVGDLVANGYTAMERLQTLAVELPADVRAGDIKTSLLDLSLVAWGGVQVVAEVVPGFDNLTDLGETFLQSARDEMARQRAYWQLLAALQRGDHLRAPKYLFLRPLSHDSARLWRSALRWEEYAGWHGRGHPLARLEVLNDALLRSDSRLLFAVGVELAVRRSENETHFELARQLGFRSERTGAFDDAIAYVGLDVSRQIKGDVSQGDRVLDPLRAPPAFPHVGYRIDCRRGEQTVQFLMQDLAQTEPLVVDNLVFNLIDGAALVAGGPTQESLSLAVGQTLEGARVHAHLAADPAGRKVVAPEILGRKCVQPRVLGSAVLDVRTVGEWPGAGLTLLGLSPGVAVIELHWPATRKLPELVLPMTVEVSQAAPPAVDGEWTLTLTMTQTTRKPAGVPRTEAERRAARDSLSLTAPAAPPLGENAQFRARLSGRLLELWNADESQWVVLASVRVERVAGRTRVQLQAAAQEAMALSGQLEGDERALAGEFVVSDGPERDSYRAQLTR